MHYPIFISPELTQQLHALWGYEQQAQLLDITAFGDFFIQLTNSEVMFYSLTDGQVIKVTELVEEFGLPPVNLDLGDEWYQYNAQALLNEKGLILGKEQCFGFIKPLFDNENAGIYGPENIDVISIIEYHRRLLPLMGR